MVGIARSGVHRTRQNVDSRIKLLVYGLAGTITGVAVGALLGAVGGLIPLSGRAAIATVLSAPAIFIGVLELSGRRVRVLQIDRETPYEWLAPGPLKWAVRNGTAIGFGGRTRLGFWLWYVIPIGALVSASPLLAATGWGIYSFCRTFGAGLMAALERRSWFTDIELLRYASQARMATNSQLVMVGVGTILLVGL